MNTLCLENYGVSKMETREIRDTSGGIFPILGAIATVGTLLYLAGAAAHVIYDAATDHEETHC